MAWKVKRDGWLGHLDEFEAIERWFGSPDPVELTERYDAALAALADEDVETWLQDAARAGISDKAARHFRADWLDGSTIPGVGRAQLEQALRAGFTEALTAARENVLPTSILWVMLGDGPDAFGVSSLVGANAVTVVVSVPKGTIGAAAAS